MVKISSLKAISKSNIALIMIENTTEILYIPQSLDNKSYQGPCAGLKIKSLPGHNHRR